MFINIPAKNSFAKYKPKQWNIGRVRRSQSFVPFTEHWEDIVCGLLQVCTSDLS
ncbi:hypothetical protein T06_5010 [Trichinella sp. T6]|nr:hypothetical protein T06_5010 [Trichinella sp. T6]